MQEKVCEIQGCANLIWEEMVNGVWKVAKVVMNKLKGFGTKDKESYQWDENVQENIKNKKDCFKALELDNNTKSCEKY